MQKKKLKTALRSAKFLMYLDKIECDTSDFIIVTEYHHYLDDEVITRLNARSGVLPLGINSIVIVPEDCTVLVDADADVLQDKRLDGIKSVSITTLQKALKP